MMFHDLKLTSGMMNALVNKKPKKAKKNELENQKIIYGDESVNSSVTRNAFSNHERRS